MKRIALALALLSGLGTGAGLAQTSPETTGVVVEVGPLPVATPVARVATPVDDRPTAEQSRALGMAKRFIPGVYRIRSLHAGYCLAAVGDSNAFVLENCALSGSAAASNQFVVLPHPRGGYTIRVHPYRALPGGRPNSGSEIGNCATTARGVVFGAARIEAKGCDIDGTDWTMAGVLDQRYAIQPVAAGSSSYRIAMLDGGDALDCWVLRGGSRDILTEVIRWQCAATPDQAWQFEWVGPLLSEWEPRLLDLTDWYRTSAGHRSIARARGIDLVGSDFNSFDTIADGGDGCRKLCAGSNRCRSWTWTAAGFNGNGFPMCYLKDAIPQPTNRGTAFFDAVVSGIVRP